MQPTSCAPQRRRCAYDSRRCRDPARVCVSVGCVRAADGARADGRRAVGWLPGGAGARRSHFVHAPQQLSQLRRSQLVRCATIRYAWNKGCRHCRGGPDAPATLLERRRLPTQVAYLDLARMRLQTECGLLHVGPAACLAGRLTLLPGIMGAPAQVLLKALSLSVLTHPLVRCKCHVCGSMVSEFFEGYCAITRLLIMHMTWGTCRHLGRNRIGRCDRNWHMRW